MKSIRVGRTGHGFVLVLFLCVGGVAGAGGAPESSHDANTSPSLESAGGGSQLQTVRRVLEVHARMDFIVRLAYDYLPTDYGFLQAQDDLASRTPQFMSWLMTPGFTVENYPKWRHGDALRWYFKGPRHPGGHRWIAFDLTDEEFNEFMTDSFDPAKGRFRYCMSPPGKYSPVSGILLASMGPDGDLDLDISRFDLQDKDYGLGKDFANRIYDPTNGVISNGDILSSTGGGPCKETNGTVYPEKGCEWLN